MTGEIIFRKRFSEHAIGSDINLLNHLHRNKRADPSNIGEKVTIPRFLSTESLLFADQCPGGFKSSDLILFLFILGEYLRYFSTNMYLRYLASKYLNRGHLDLVVAY